MLLFAMLTYWLLQITPNLKREEHIVQPVHEEDYFMKHLSLTTFEKNGRIKTYLMGNYARHYPDTDTIEIDDPQIYTQSFEKKDRSQKAEGTANKASSNADSTLIELRGNVVLIKKDQRNDGQEPVITKMVGEYLKINTDTEKISSNLPVEIQKGPQIIVGNAMEYDNVERRLKMAGNVRVIISKNEAQKKGY